MLSRLIKTTPRMLNCGAARRLPVPARFFADGEANKFEFKEDASAPCASMRAHCSKELQGFVQMFESNKRIHQNVVKGLSDLCKAKDAMEKVKKEKQMLAEINEQNEGKLAEIQAMVEQQETDRIDIAKRMEGEFAKTKLYAVTNLAKEALEIADNIDRSLLNIRGTAFAKAPGQGKAAQSVEEVSKQLEKLLGEYGIRRMEIKAGDKVDPNFHHIIAFVPIPDKQNDEILEVTQVGYTIGERVLRAAKVVVIKN